MKPPDKILIIKPSSLGDIVHGLPFLNAVRKRFPKSEIHWIVFKGFEGLLEGHHMIDRLWVIDKELWKKPGRAGETIGEISSFVRALKKERFDLVVDLQGLLRSGLIAAATGAGMRVGFKEAREGGGLFYTEKVTGGSGIHAVDRYMKIAEFLGCDTSDIIFPFPDFPSSQGPFPLSLKDYAVIVPGARWKTKIWPAKKFGELASLLPFRSVIMGSKRDIAAADKIVSLSKGKSVSLAGRTSLRELIEVMRGARVVVTNDSGPMHIAAALGVPVLAIFGPTDPARTGPYGNGHTVIKSDEACAPCLRRSCGDLKCMEGISVKRVLEAIENSRN